jgi:hypothetical protein
MLHGEHRVMLDSREWPRELKEGGFVVFATTSLFERQLWCALDVFLRSQFRSVQSPWQLYGKVPSTM